MSADLYDLATRLRAAHHGAVVHRSTHATALVPFHPVALTTTRNSDGSITLAATSDGQHAEGTDADALAALDTLCVDLTEAHRTLVIATRTDLRALADLAHRHGRSTSALGHQRVASVLAWWVQRADHPGTGAVLVVVDALRDRYTLPTGPEAERHLATWCTALAVPTTGPAALLDLATLATSGTALQGLGEAREADHRSWAYHRDRMLAGRPWATRDSRREAALGLTARCHAAELHDSNRLRDPLVAAREAFTGNVVTGHVTHADRHTLTIVTSRPISRLRVDGEVTGWVGTALDADATTTRLTRGRLSAATIDTTGTLTLTIADVLTRPSPLTVGTPITVLARPADPRQQSNGRRNLADRYRPRTNWLANGTAPDPRRRDVPLDVVIAAAD